jgi:hypothetical protein
VYALHECLQLGVRTRAGELASCMAHASPQNDARTNSASEQIEEREDGISDVVQAVLDGWE